MRGRTLLITALLVVTYLYDMWVIINLGLWAFLYYSLAPTVIVLLISYVIYRASGSAEGTDLGNNLALPGMDRAIERLKREVEELRLGGVSEELVRLELVLVDNLVRTGRYEEAWEVLRIAEDDMRALGAAVSKELKRQYSRIRKSVKRRLKHRQAP
ncbi:hypothetical protein [Vulcanisaeta thermophila]|uniref:hypothetical protein n=1 Tax=Vulcanisaeta thermophila TaxID=867917 RepID=UPI0008529445|nr:hypothetical protein [Vulcanisaeta thermophila]